MSPPCFRDGVVNVPLMFAQLLLNFEIEFVDPAKPCAKITNYAGIFYEGMFVKVHKREEALV